MFLSDKKVGYVEWWIHLLKVISNQCKISVASPLKRTMPTPLKGSTPVKRLVTLID